jgi:hypothetical protein
MTRRSFSKQGRRKLAVTVVSRCSLLPSKAAGSVATTSDTPERPGQPNSSIRAL